jgi:hypothetical protein
MAPLYNTKTSAIQSGTPPAPATIASAKAVKNHLDGRCSTSGPEAMASSDDDRDHESLAQRITAPATKPQRRASWLNDVSLAAKQTHSLPRGPITSGVSSSIFSDQVPWTAKTSAREVLQLESILEKLFPLGH